MAVLYRCSRRQRRQNSSSADQNAGPDCLLISSENDSSHCFFVFHKRLLCSALLQSCCHEKKTQLVLPWSIVGDEKQRDEGEKHLIWSSVLSPLPPKFSSVERLSKVRWRRIAQPPKNEKRVKQDSNLRDFGTQNRRLT